MPLAGTPPRYHFDDRERHDLQVGGNPALCDIFKIATNHAVEVGVVTVGHLPPASYAWLNGQTLQVVLGVLRDLIRQRRARAHHRHLPQEHVQELRELVDGVLADEPADPGDAGVLLHLEHGAGDLVLLLELIEAFVGVLVHGAELPHAEGRQAAVGAGLPYSDLAVEWAALALQADERR